MTKPSRIFHPATGMLVLAVLVCGCSGLTNWQRAGVAGAVGVMAVSPNANVEQTYYLGSYDPHEQLPPAVYRIRVRGQSSVLNRTRFASGWVPAEVVDSLNRSVSMNVKSGDITYSGGTQDSSLANAGRSLVMFGPEGFREAPRGHRLVVIMGASPEAVEQAFSNALGTVAHAKFGEDPNDLDRRLFARLAALQQEKDRIKLLVRQP